MFTVFTDMNINDFKHVVMLGDIERSWRSHIITAAISGSPWLTASDISARTDVSDAIGLKVLK